MVIGIYLLCIGIWDSVEKKIPIILLVPGIAATAIEMVRNVGAVCNSIPQDTLFLPTLLFSLLGLLPGMILLLVAWSSKKVGYGDAVVILCLGGILGYNKVMGILMSSLFIMSVVSIVLLALKKVRKESTLPYFPFLFLGYEVWCVAMVN